MSQEHFCCLPFNSVSVAPFGAIRVCCNNYQLPTTLEGKHYSFNEESFALSEALNSSFHKELRLSMIEGSPHPSCHRCWDIEKQGGVSYRQSWNRRYASNFSDYLENMNPDGSLKTVRADYVEITLGNLCNLRCRMCNPFSSIQWLREAKELGLISGTEEEQLKQFNWFEKPTFERTLEFLLRHTDRLNFLGGEPLIIPEHKKILKKLIELGLASGVEIQYNTNLTRLDPELCRLWSRFKMVFLNVSVDGYGELNEYIRHPMTWSRFLNHLETLRGWSQTAPLSVSLHCTFQAINVLQLPRLYDFVYNLNMGFARIPFVIWVNFPEYHDPRVLPRALREQAYERQIGWLNQVSKESLKDYEMSWLGMMRSHIENLRDDWAPEVQASHAQEFLRITRALDVKRGQNLGQLVPELKAWLDS